MCGIQNSNLNEMGNAIRNKFIRWDNYLQSLATPNNIHYMYGYNRDGSDYLRGNVKIQSRNLTFKEENGHVPYMVKLFYSNHFEYKSNYSSNLSTEQIYIGFRQTKTFKIPNHLICGTALWLDEPAFDCIVITDELELVIKVLIQEYLAQ